MGRNWLRGREIGPGDSTSSVDADQGAKKTAILRGCAGVRLNCLEGSDLERRGWQAGPHSPQAEAVLPGCLDASSPHSVLLNRCWSGQASRLDHQRLEGNGEPGHRSMERTGRGQKPLPAGTRFE